MLCGISCLFYLGVVIFVVDIAFVVVVLLLLGLLLLFIVARFIHVLMCLCIVVWSFLCVLLDVSFNRCCC